MKATGKAAGEANKRYPGSEEDFSVRKKAMMRP